MLQYRDEIHYLKTHCIAMEHDNTTLEQMISDQQQHWNTIPGSAKGILSIAKAIIDGLLHLYNNYIIHNDLKTKNILMSNDHRPVICDFGEAYTVDKHYCINIYKGAEPLHYIEPQKLSMQSKSCST